ncbi:MAG: class I mannose-6-phosphate isomerase [Verrucomicrobia bacterium]|nr:class I mannose-6-phosphate isomerase [Verrucomicrobiota bacterium]
MLYPLQFEPILKERVWGGNHLHRLYGKPAPTGLTIGESWEITDRPEGVSVIRNGPLAGRDLRWLMEHHRAGLLGNAAAQHNHFPLLCKILDASQKLSLQVHPPASVAARLGGAPKTEMWFIAHAEPGAELYAGLRHGVTRALFESRIADGTVADCFHRLPVQRGDVMFLPSGRVHALGAGLVIFEIQQNSDTTYRVFDWNRVGLDGKPRDLHIEQSLACIDFSDFEPSLVQAPWHTAHELRRKTLVRSDLFQVDQIALLPQSILAIEGGQMRILAAVEGAIQLTSGTYSLRLAAGQFCLLPATLPEASVTSGTPATLLDITL